MQKITVLGYPSTVGGAGTELWHTLLLWRMQGWEITLVPTWSAPDKWRRLTDSIGCKTLTLTPSNLEAIAGHTVVSFCNDAFLVTAPALHALACKLVWVNCMTYLFPAERTFYKAHGPFDAMVYQSEYQRNKLEPDLLANYKYERATGHTIHGAFMYDAPDWEYRPRAHESNDTFVFGRMARPDKDKWSSNTWGIYGQVPYNYKRGLLMGVNDATETKIGKPPAWGDQMKPDAMPVTSYLELLHALVPINGGAGENWPRAGLEAMAIGVPVVAENSWGWPEQIQHGVTGLLGNNDAEIAYLVAMLAYDETLRLNIAKAARERMQDELANVTVLARQWSELFEQVQ